VGHAGGGDVDGEAVGEGVLGAAEVLGDAGGEEFAVASGRESGA
jgi:hypothetical protein